QNDPLVATTRSVFLLDHTLAIQTTDGQSILGSRFGNDVMAGGANDDALFGQLGSDMVQGDGMIKPETLDILVFEGVQANGTVTDGNDYIEGNGGEDMLIGNLGQDDIIGGSSEFFGLTSGTMRPDGSDIIFGGAATGERVKRHAFTGDIRAGLNANGALVDSIAFGNNLVRRHATDSDFIMGDNANIFRIVQGTNGPFAEFNYDKGTFLNSSNVTTVFEDRGTLRIVVRSYRMLDYTPIESDNSSIGAGDVIHGESGDDFIHGMTGGDILYGDAE